MPVELFEKMESSLPRCLASHAFASIQSLEPRQRLLDDIGQFIVGEGAFFLSAKSVLTLSMSAAHPQPGRSSSIDMKASRPDH